MKYKALIFDLDGTAIETRREALPSDKLVEIVKLAQKKAHLSAATGRPWPNAKRIIKRFNLKSPCIISAGTQIIDPRTEKILWQQSLTKKQVEEVIKILSSYPYQVYFSNEHQAREGIPAAKKKVAGPESVVYVLGVPKKEAEMLNNKVGKVKNIKSHLAGSWTKNAWDLHITHKNATKKQALEKLIQLLKVRKEDVVVVGDTGNDMPLFESAGFKVAMGNATDELKKAADYIAPSISQDGVVDVVNRYIL